MYLLKRLTEASTWASLAAVGQLGAAVVPQYAGVFHGVTLMAATLGGLIADKASQ